MASYRADESVTNTAAPRPALFPSEKNLRQSDRVFLTLPIRVSGDAGQGKKFLEEGQTVDISRQGATIMMERELFAGQIVKIERVGVDKEAMARVVGRVTGRSGGHLFGVTLLDTATNLWDVVFPAVAEVEKAVLRALLSCIACDRLEVSYLNEFDADLFLRHHCICRICSHCGGWTTWTRPHGNSSPDTSAPDELNSPQARPRHLLAPATQNQRAHDRVQVETVGCARHPTLGNEVVLVKNLARGGLSFYSATNYVAGSHIEMAVPYTSRAPNIYAPAKIVSSRKATDKGLIEYGVAYVM